VSRTRAWLLLNVLNPHNHRQHPACALRSHNQNPPPPPPDQRACTPTRTSPREPPLRADICGAALPRRQPAGGAAPRRLEAGQAAAGGCHPGDRHESALPADPGAAEAPSRVFCRQRHRPCAAGALVVSVSCWGAHFLRIRACCLHVASPHAHSTPTPNPSLAPNPNPDTTDPNPHLSPPPPHHQQMKAVLHAADISNPVRPFGVALSMVNRVHEEFELQARAERGAGLPVTPHMDVSSMQDRAKMEVRGGWGGWVGGGGCEGLCRSRGCRISLVSPPCALAQSSDDNITITTPHGNDLTLRSSSWTT